MGIPEWLYETYVKQLVCDAHPELGCPPNFNPVDTATYALVLGLALYGVFKMLKRWGVKINTGFILATAPYVLVGSSLRVIEDSGALKGTDGAYLVITPIIYFTVFGGTVLPLLTSLKLQRMGRVKDYKKIYGGFGLAWGLVNLGVLAALAPVRNAWVLALAVGTGVLGGWLAMQAGRRVAKAAFLAPWTSGAVLGAHTIDAASSFAGITYLRYVPEHVLETFLINSTGTAASIFAVKWVVLVPVLYLVKKSFKPEEEGMKNLVLLVILILGLAPGLRNTLRMTFGV